MPVDSWLVAARELKAGGGAFEVTPGNLEAVEIDHEAVIVIHVQGHGADSIEIFDLESVSKVDRNVGIFHVFKNGSNQIEPVPITESRGGDLPVTVIKIFEGPGDGCEAILFTSGRLVRAVRQTISIRIQVEREKVTVDSSTFEHGVVGSICNKDNCAIILGRSSPGGKKNKYASAAAEKSHSVPPGMYFHEK